MFLSDELLYVQLQKSGSTHIAMLLEKLFEGETVIGAAKHRPVTVAERESGRPVFCSIRNPWNWYVSMWTFGMEHKGIRVHLTRRRFKRFVWPRGSFPVSREFFDELRKDVAAWRAVYTSPDDIDAFRAWLRRITDPTFAIDLREGYARSGIAAACGFMTWRYLYLSCRDVHELAGAERSLDDVRAFDERRNFIAAYIRQENLEESLIEALETMQPLTDEQKTIIREGGNHNRSERPLPVAAYYTDELIELVAERERLIVETFGYTPPN